MGAVVCASILRREALKYFGTKSCLVAAARLAFVASSPLRTRVRMTPRTSALASALASWVRCEV